MTRRGRGRLDAFNQLVLRHQALAYGVAHRMLGNPDDAADATQEGFIKAYRRLDQYRGGGTSFRAWLMRIVVNTCYDMLRSSMRSRRRQSALIVNFDPDSGEDEWGGNLQDPSERPEEYVLRREVAERLQMVIYSLPADQRMVLILSDIEGLPYTEIANIIGAPIGTVKSRLSRARGRVRDAIEPRQPGLARGRTRQSNFAR